MIREDDNLFPNVKKKYKNVATEARAELGGKTLGLRCRTVRSYFSLPL